MSTKVLLDTCILIDFLNGVPGAAKEINSHPDRAISIITWIEVMVGTNPLTETDTRSYLDKIPVLLLDNTVAEKAVNLTISRRQAGKKNLKVPDASILATAQVSERILVTRNTKDFPADDPGIQVPKY